MNEINPPNTNRHKNWTPLFIVSSLCLLVIMILGFYKIDRLSNLRSDLIKSASTLITSITSNKALPTGTTSTPTSPKIPILMYHYIRDFSDQNDPGGISLSIAPAKFAAQLDYLKLKGYQTITFKDVEQNRLPSKPVILTFDDGYADFYQNAFPELKKRQMVAVSYIITNFNGGKYLNDTQLREIDRYGIEIGSHSVSHPNLSTASPYNATHQIADSKSTLEKTLGHGIISFCYPSGKFSSETVKIVEDAGYKYATTTEENLADFRNPFTLARFRIKPSTEISTILK